MATSKPDLRRVWAEGAPPANIEDPDVTLAGKYDAGWTAEIPPYENFNFIQQLLTQGLAHINEQGVPEWDILTDYPIGALAKGSDGNLYKGEITPNVGNDPISSPITEWSLAFENTDYFTDSGASNAYILTSSAGNQAPLAYIDGLPITFRPAITNTGASTVNVSGLGVKNIKTSSGGDPASGEIVAGEITMLLYDTANGWFEILQLGALTTDASETVKGIAELATQAEADAGVDDTRIVTPLKMRFGFASLFATNGYVTFPSWLGGLIIQWGTLTGIAHLGTGTVTFPIAFPTAGFHSSFMQVTATGAVSAENYSLTLTTTQTTIFNTSGVTATYRWIALGH